MISNPGGGLGIFANRDERSIFLILNFENLYFGGGGGYWSQLLCFFGLLNKRCILKCFICLTVFFWLQFYSPGASIIMGLHYYHIMLDFCEMNSVFESIFLGFCFSKSVFFLGFLLVAENIFWVVQKYPTPLIPVCRFVKSTPWDKQ